MVKKNKNYNNKNYLKLYIIKLKEKKNYTKTTLTLQYILEYLVNEINLIDFLKAFI